MQRLEDATNLTTPFLIWKALVVDASGLSYQQANQFDRRIHTAFDMGEAAWMVADELKLRASAPRPSKTPRELAVRVVRF